MCNSGMGGQQQLQIPGGTGPANNMQISGGQMYGSPNQMPGGIGSVNYMQQPGGPMMPMMPQPGGPQVIGAQSHGNLGQPHQAAPGGGWNNIGQPGFATGGPNDPANGGSGWQPPQQNPGMYMPGTQGPSLGRPPFANIQNPGMPSMGGSFRPPVQNPGMQMPPSNGPGTLIDGGPQGNLYNPQGAFQNLSEGTLPSMKRFIQAGKMGKAKQAFEAGGGTWNKSVHKRLKNKYGTGN
jgi:hypothetical protein